MLLSICIPTHNRAAYLQKTLDSIVAQDGWPFADVEVVISDNGSSDETAELISGYVKHFPDNIRAERIDPVIDAHENFDFVLSMGRGEFVKLNNDTLMWNPGMLSEFVQMIRKCRADVFLTPATPMSPAAALTDHLVSSMDEAVDKCSYFLTWIGNLCVRKEIFMKLEDRNRKIASRLTQVDVILRLLASGAKGVVDGRIFFQSQDIVKKLDYQVMEVFGVNYFQLLSEYLGNGISEEVFEREKRRMLFDFLIPSHFDFFHEKAGVRQSGFWKNSRIYHRDLYFYAAFGKIFLLWLASRFFTHDQLRKIKYKLFGKKLS